GLQGTIALALGDATGVELDTRLQGGELLAGAFYAALPGHAVRLQLSGEGRDGAWRAERLHFDDPGALQLAGSLALEPAAETPLARLALDITSADLGLANARYLSGVLGMAGLGALELSGALDGSLQLADGSLERADA